MGVKRPDAADGKGMRGNIILCYPYSHVVFVLSPLCVFQASRDENKLY